jgi:hypothetical protein
MNDVAQDSLTADINLINAVRSTAFM